MKGVDNTKLISYLSSNRTLEISSIVVKRKGTKELFDERKLYGSVYAACTTAGFSSFEREKLAHEIASKIKMHVQDKATINSSEIRSMVVSELTAADAQNVLACYEAHCPNN